MQHSPISLPEMNHVSARRPLCIACSHRRARQITSLTHRLVVERLDDVLRALLALKHNLGNDDGLRLKQPAAADQPAHGRHGALNVRGGGARREVLRHHHERARQPPDRHALALPHALAATAGGGVAGPALDHVHLLRCKHRVQLRLYQSLGRLRGAPLLPGLLLLGGRLRAGRVEAAGQRVGLRVGRLGPGQRRVVQVVRPLAVDVARRGGSLGSGSE